MTPSNLAICIGCSLLCPKDQSSNSFTKCSIIIELMIVHHKQLFPQDNQSDQPDLIPTGLHENLLDMEFPQPLVKKEPPLPDQLNRFYLDHQNHPENIVRHLLLPLRLFLEDS